MKDKYYNQKSGNIILMILMILSLIIVTYRPAYSQLTKPNEAGPWNGMYVNTFTGNFYYENNIFITPGIGLALDISFFYNSGRTEHDWGYGNGWSFSYNMLYRSSGDDIIIDKPDGQKFLYTWNGSYYSSPKGVYDTLYEYASDKFILQTKYGMKYYFDDASHAKLTKIEDRNGNTNTIDYTSGYPSKIHDASGRDIFLSWVDNRLEEISDPNTNPIRTISLDYDAEGNMTDLGDPMGNYTYYDYGPRGNIIGITDPRNNYVEITYNEKGAVDGFTMPSDESFKTLYYDTINHTTTATLHLSAGSLNTTYEFDNEGRVANVFYDPGTNVGFAWDDKNNLTALIDENGNMTTYVYDVMGNLVAETDANGNTITYTYDPQWNLPATITDANGNVTSYTYDKNGNLITIQDPLGNQITNTYSSYNGSLINYVDYGGFATDYQYNDYGDLGIITDHGGNSTSFSYDIVGNQLSVHDPNGNQTNYTYDAMNRLISTIDPFGNEYIISYDENGNVTSETDKNGNTTTYTYDELNRLISSTDPLGGVTQNTYDKAGNLISETNANGATIYFEYNDKHDLITIMDPMLSEVNMVYNPVGNMTGITDNNGNSSSYEYDAVNHLTKFTQADGTFSTYDYDAAGNVISIVDFNGNTTNYTYDELNRLINKTFQDGSTSTFEYNANGNVTSMNQVAMETILIEVNYDYAGRELGVEFTFPNFSRAVDYSYDPIDNLETINTKSGSIIYDYDALNRKISTTDQIGGITSFTYDNVGNLLDILYPNTFTSLYEYDPLNRLIDLQTNDSKGTFVQGFVYTYDAVGNRLSEINLFGDGIYTTYDEMNRIVEVDDMNTGDLSQYSYDGVGNRMVKVHNGNVTEYLYDVNNRLVTEGETYYQYDNNGNRILRESGPELFSYHYDYENNLINMITPTSDIYYSYLPNGNRFHINENGYHKYLVYHGNSVLEELDEIGNLYYKLNPGISMATEAGELISYYHYDNELGINDNDCVGCGEGEFLKEESVTLASDNKSAITGNVIYDEFGNVKELGGWFLNGDIWYKGMHLDMETDLYSINSGYIDPVSYTSLTMNYQPNILFARAPNPVKTFILPQINIKIKFPQYKPLHSIQWAIKKLKKWGMWGNKPDKCEVSIVAQSGSFMRGRTYGFGLRGDDAIHIRSSKVLRLKGIGNPGGGTYKWKFTTPKSGFGYGSGKPTSGVGVFLSQRDGAYKATVTYTTPKGKSCNSTVTILVR